MFSFNKFSKYYKFKNFNGSFFHCELEFKFVVTKTYIIVNYFNLLK